MNTPQSQTEWILSYFSLNDHVVTGSFIKHIISGSFYQSCPSVQISHNYYITDWINYFG